MMCVVDGNGKSYNIICMICVCSIKGSPTATQLMNTTPSCLGRALFILPYANVICRPLMCLWLVVELVPVLVVSIVTKLVAVRLYRMVGMKCRE